MEVKKENLNVEDRHILWNKEQVTELLGISVSGLYSAMNRGQFPKPIKIGGVSRWRKSDVLSFIDNCQQELAR